MTRALIAIVRGLATAVRSLVRARRLLQGLAVLALSFVGVWFVYEPAAYLTVAALLLVDLVTDRR